MIPVMTAPVTLKIDAGGRADIGGNVMPLSLEGTGFSAKDFSMSIQGTSVQGSI